jgi:hypothetical protein
MDCTHRQRRMAMKKGMFIIPVSMILVIGLVILGATPTEFSAQEAKNYTMAVNGEQYPILSTMVGMINK